MSAPGRQDFRLTWVNYSQKLTESFHKFLTSEILCNVTLWVHTKTSSNCIKAHQVREHLQMRSGKSGGGSKGVKDFLRGNLDKIL